MASPRIPLTGAADAMLARLAASTGSPAIAVLDGPTLLGERAALQGFRIPSRVAAGGGCRLYDTRDGIIALNLARPVDRELLSALFRDDALKAGDDLAIKAAAATHGTSELVAQGRVLGLPIAALHDPHPVVLRGQELWCDTLAGTAPALLPAQEHALAARPRPRILDLSALWAGPLAAHLLWLAGAEVIKVESPTRPDAMRDGQAAFYDLLNQGKASVALDLRLPADRTALLDLIAQADIVIEAARPRALLQLGIDADALVRANPALVWLTITAHGMAGDAANWVGFGDDVGVAAGLSAALHNAAGTIGFVGDAIADPLTGIAAALAGHTNWAQGRGGRIGIAMREVAAAALADEQARDPVGLVADLRNWARAVGQLFPSVTRRPAEPARPFGGDPPRWSARC